MNMPIFGMKIYGNMNYGSLSHKTRRLKQLEREYANALCKYEVTLKKAIQASYNQIVPRGSETNMLKFLIGEVDIASLPIPWQNIFKEEIYSDLLLATYHIKLNTVFKHNHIMIKKDLHKILKYIFRDSNNASEKLNQFLSTDFHVDSCNQSLLADETCYDILGKKNGGIRAFEDSSADFFGSRKMEEVNNYFCSKVGNISKEDRIIRGTHKYFKAGYVYALDAPGRNDFSNEESLAKYLKQINSDKLLNCVSLQTRPDKINFPNLAYVNISDSFTYLNNYTAPDDGMNEVMNLIFQLIDIHRELYENKVIHCDAHSGNIKIEYLNEGPVMKIFDFGKSKFGNIVKASERFVDLKYLLFKTSAQFGDQIRRSFRENFADPHNKIQKHYPLHKLINQLGIAMDDIENKLTNLGKKLLGRLEQQIRVKDCNANRNNFSESYKEFLVQEFEDFSLNLEDWIRNYPHNKMYIVCT